MGSGVGCALYNIIDIEHFIYYYDNFLTDGNNCLNKLPFPFLLEDREVLLNRGDFVS